MTLTIHRNSRPVGTVRFVGIDYCVTGDQPVTRAEVWIGERYENGFACGPTRTFESRDTAEMWVLADD